MNNTLLKEVAARFTDDYKLILKKIKEYDHIVVFRHQMPDFDALGTQLGLATWLKDNFPNKTIHVVGENHVTFTPRLYPYMDEVEDYFFDEPFLAIVVDTADTKRISDDRYQKASYIIKIDHHPNRDGYGNINVVADELAAASELVANMLFLFPKKYVFSKEAARYLYSGIVGDSGRFLYNSTTPHTFEIAGLLVSKGLLLSQEVYQPMYQKNIQDLRVTAYVLTHFEVSPHGVAYYVLSEEIQKELQITVERGKENINQFANIDGIEIWCSITQDTKRNRWKVSIRSKALAVNEVASHFKGGGHDQASGAEITTLDELPKLIQELDDLIVSHSK